MIPRLLILASLSAGTLLGGTPTLTTEIPSDEAHHERTTLTGDWGGARTSLESNGIGIDLLGVYTLQGVANGGLPLGDDLGNLFSAYLDATLDTEKAGLWSGGFLKVRVEGRTGDAPLVASGGTSPVNNQALFPLIEGSIGSEAWALTELTFTQFITEKIAIAGGLINTTYGDNNPITGNSVSHQHFMNMAFLYSPIEAAVVPAVTLGGGMIIFPMEGVMGSFMVVGSEETAGTNPFQHYEGTTFSTEWEIEYELGDKPGGIVFGGLYSINQPRTDFTANPRLILTGLIEEGEIEETEKDSWSVFWNGFQYLTGNEERGMGVFARLGLSDADPNPIHWHGAVGLGGVGTFAGRNEDRWGIGFYYQKFSDDEVFDSLGVDDEMGGEMYYNIAVTPWMNVSLDAQVVESAIAAASTAVVLGTRVSIRF